jgi:hypothetical protein
MANATRFGVVGALTGIGAAAGTFLPLGEFAGIEVGGHCLGIRATAGAACAGIDGSFYVFPGLLFGVVFAALMRRDEQLGLGGAVIYAAGAAVANALAVFVCLALVDPLSKLLPIDNFEVDMAVAGVVAGVVGSLVLGGVLAVLNPEIGRLWPIAAGAGLGLLTPLVPNFATVGIFAFYILWQGGYAAALAASLPGSAAPAAANP